jgi:TonB family protein
MNVSSHCQILTAALLLITAAPMIAQSASKPNAPATPVATVTPSYPYLMKHAGSTADVTVSFTVNTQGTVTKASIVDSNNIEFNVAALDAIKKWTVTPAMKNGNAVETKLQQTFTFRVDDKPKTGGSPVQVAEKASRKAN